MLAASAIKVLSTEAQNDAISRAGQPFHYLPTPSGLGDPKNWPKVWSTQDDFDLMARLNQLPFHGTTGFSDTASDVAQILQQTPELLQKGLQIINQAGPHLDTILQVVQDPALPQLVDRIKALQQLEAAKPAAPSTGGVGIDKLIPIVDAAIFVEQHPAAKFAFEHPVLVGIGAAVILLGAGAGVGIVFNRWNAKRHAAKATVGRTYRRRS